MTGKVQEHDEVPVRRRGFEHLEHGGAGPVHGPGAELSDERGRLGLSTIEPQRRALKIIFAVILIGFANSTST